VQDESQFKRRSDKPPVASLRLEAPMTVRGFTAGGSGRASNEASIINAPRTQIVHDSDFIPVWASKSIITDFQRRDPAKRQRMALRSASASL